MNSRVSTPTTAHRRHHTPKPEASSEAALKQALRREVRKRKDAEKHLEIATQFDDLTGLANRNLALRRLEQATEKARLEGGKAALLYLDLIDFKAINNAFGYECGDCILRDIGQRLQSISGASDTVARITGDEFVFLQLDIQGHDSVYSLLAAIQEVLHRPFQTKQTELLLNFCLGFSIFPDWADNWQELSRQARVALSNAKGSRENKIHAYDPAQDKSTDQFGIIQETKKALRHDEFRLHYQPIVDLKSAQVVAYESLLRWQKPDRMIPPGAFLPVIEHTEIMTEIGDFVLSTACEQMNNWLMNLSTQHAFKLSVNISANQLASENFPYEGQSLFEAYRLATQRFIFEVTETAVIENIDHAKEVLTEFANLGVEIWLDDFGTGYSSLLALRELPISVVKIDKTFVTGIDQPDFNPEFLRALINLSHDLGKRVLAEGVETRAQRDILIGYGCDLAQGFYFGHPLPPSEAVPLS
ncbi:putative bifunctional diguanylate cyclase/phosphodiesterase [Desulfohalobium retbaense]|uniref:Diguanylate cyclase/phosphodiesterase n=1 Tax=Desulfohalobium retbaense (strain ATCC 49708 / DSM 5692 / JCM 16813 / HR100) TaxID=485915 RepID=C8X196_DESRD|nr:bifunctional diguanylate cyclase/phosphodiesterase [Desulfohalobium retbaense]ACV68193.1 diguanylate cyclase/phosphodiesterase [Desulfohalobium retbaense DSM 5692]